MLVDLFEEERLVRKAGIQSLSGIRFEQGERVVSVDLVHRVLIAVIHLEQELSELI